MLVEKISLPPDVKKGETVNINVVVRASEPAAGTLQIYQKTADNSSLPIPGSEQPQRVDLQRGVNVFTLKQLITEPNFYTFTAEFVPDRDSGDRRAKQQHGRRLHPGPRRRPRPADRGDHGRARRAGPGAPRQEDAGDGPGRPPRSSGGGLVGGDPLPTDLAELQPYDAVILGNVPKDVFTDAQIKLLEANVHDMGAGLIMLGGPQSFGAGGWRNTPVEKALPVDMEITAQKVMGKAAMVMIMHASEIPEGNYWQKVVAQEALKTLSPLRLRRHAPLAGPGVLALHAPADRRAAGRDAPGDRPDDARRHARLRPVAPDGARGAAGRPTR